MLPPLLTLALKTYSKLIWLITKPEACTHYHGLCQSMSFQLSGVFLVFFHLASPLILNSICKKHRRFPPSRGCCLSAFSSSNMSNFKDSSFDKQSSANSRVLSQAADFCDSDRQSELICAHAMKKHLCWLSALQKQFRDRPGHNAASQLHLPWPWQGNCSREKVPIQLSLLLPFLRQHSESN